MTHFLPILLSLFCAASASLAGPVVPTSDAEVIERLSPAARTSRSADPAVAVAEARALLAASRRDGDPRLAGRALARLSRWQAQPLAPVDVVLILAETEQYLHNQLVIGLHSPYFRLLLNCMIDQYLQLMK